MSVTASHTVADCIMRPSGTVASTPYSIPWKEWAVHMAVTYRRARLWLWVCALLAFAGLAVGLAYDLRFAIVGLMAVFILTPMVIAMLYIVYGMLPVNSLNPSLHSVTVHPGGLMEVTLYPRVRTAEEEDEAAGTPDTPLRLVSVRRDALLAVSFDTGGAWLCYEDGKDRGWFRLPRQALGEEAYNALFPTLRQLKQQQCD